MGFSNAIYKFPKFGNTTLNQIFNIESYYSYEDNEWAKKNFNSAKEYMDYNDGCDSKNYIAPTIDQIAFYKEFLHKDQFEHTVIHDYVYDNCSGGIPFHDDIQEVLCVNYDDFEHGIELNQSDIIALLNFEISKLEKYKLEPAYIDYAFKYSDDDEDNFNEDPDIILKSCDGVEITFAEDNLKDRIDTNSKHADWGTLFMACREYIDETDYWNLFNLVKTLSNILVETDFKNETLVYCGGW